MQKSSKDIVNRLLSVTLFIIIFVGFIVIEHKISSDTFDDNGKMLLDSGWDFSMNGELTKDVKLSEFKFKMAQKGDNITLSCVLPDTKIDHPILVFILFHCIVDIDIDGTKIYKAGYNEAKQNEAVGFGRYTAVLPGDYMGKTLKIMLKVDENDAFPNIDTMWIEDEVDYATNFIYKNLFSILTSIYLFVIGVITIIICLFIGKFSKEYRKLLEIGCISISMGTWTSANGNFIKLLTDNMKIITCSEYLGAYFTLLFIYIFFSEINFPKKVRKITNFLAIFYSVFVGIIIICEIFDFRHVASFLNFSSTITMVIAILLVYFMFYDYSNKTASDKAITKGLLIIVFTGGIDIVKFNLGKYFGIDFGKEYFLLVGINIFMSIMVYAYILYIKDYMNIEAEKKVLCRLAYCDQLTGISNRTKCDEYLEQLDENNESEYFIVNFDINGLKEVNDNKGHLVGDEYICSFSKILNKCFGDIGLVGRMGGDEFVAIINSHDEKVIKEKIDDMLKMADEYNCDEKSIYEISFAYGYAKKNTESRFKADEIYEMADKLMYQCKKQQKKGR